MSTGKSFLELILFLTTSLAYRNYKNSFPIIKLHYRPFIPTVDPHYDEVQPPY